MKRVGYAVSSKAARPWKTRVVLRLRPVASRLDVHRAWGRFGASPWQEPPYLAREGVTAVYTTRNWIRFARLR